MYCNHCYYYSYTSKRKFCVWCGISFVAHPREMSLKWKKGRLRKERYTFTHTLFSKDQRYSRSQKNICVYYNGHLYKFHKCKYYSDQGNRCTWLLRRNLFGGSAIVDSMTYTFLDISAIFFYL